MKLLERFFVGLGFDLHVDRNVLESRQFGHIHLFGARGPGTRQIDLAFEVDLDVVELDAPDRGVHGIPDAQTCAIGLKDHFNGMASGLVPHRHLGRRPGA